MRKYSLTLSRVTRRLIATSSKSMGRRPSSLLKVTVTSAMPTGLRLVVPLKMTSSMRSPRSVLADCSPRTQRTASTTFDLPQPLGPEHGGDAVVDVQDGAVDERLEALQLDALEFHRNPF